jgi:hypothetical protein
VRRLEAAGVDEGLIDAYIAEENRRNPSEWQRSVAAFSQAVQRVRVTLGPRYTRDDYALAGPKK